MTNIKSTIFYFVLSLICFLLDQWTKILAVSELKDKGKIIDVLPVLRFYYAENRGAAFSFLSGQDGWQRWFFLIIGAVVVIFLCISIVKNNQRYLLIGYSLILGGAIGNMYDRFFFGYVRDMISVYYTPANFYFAVFNVADMAISIGLFFILVDFFLTKKYKE